MSDRQCKKCKVVKPMVEFYELKWYPGSYRWACKQCCLKESKAYEIARPGYRVRTYAKNREQYRKYNREWLRKHLEKDPINRVNRIFGINVYHALKGKKAGRKWEELVGYTLEDLTIHLQSKFTEGITWDNYGEVWHVDHITPKSWFKYESTDDAKFKECWALSNLQPKLKRDNIRKGNRSVG